MRNCDVPVMLTLICSLTEKELGEGEPIFEWRPKGNYLAVAGSSNLVKLYDRSGNLIDELVIPGQVEALSWDRDGDMLAIMNDKSTAVTLWEFTSKTATKLDSGMSGKEKPTFILWSHISPVLAIGYDTGNLLLYNQRTSRKTSAIGKHQSAITCGAFSNNELLALGSTDFTITVSSIDGDLLYSFMCNMEPSLIKFCDRKQQTDKNAKPDVMLGAILSQNTILLAELSDNTQLINLQCQVHYGQIVTFCWYRSNFLLLGFDKGFFVCVSTIAAEIGQEIYAVQDFKTYLSSICINESLSKVLLIGDNQIRIREMSRLDEIVEIVEVDIKNNDLCSISTNYDGRLVAASTRSGTLHLFLTKMPMLGAAYRNTIAILSSLNEITLFREGEKNPLAVVKIELEPTRIALGPKHIAITMNNRAWLYEIAETKGIRHVCEIEYLSTVNAMHLNENYAVAKLDNRAQLQKLHGEGNGFVIPDSVHASYGLQDISLTDNFLIYCTNDGHLYYYSLADERYVNEYRHVAGITSLYPEPEGITLCFFDALLNAYIYSPVDNEPVKIPSINSTAHLKSCLWENFSVDRDTFVVCNSDTIHVYLVSKNQIENVSLAKIGITNIPYGHIPLMLCKGIVHCQTQNGRIGSILLESHRTDMVFEGKSPKTLEKLLDQALNLKRWMHAWRICEYTKIHEHWNKFAITATKNGEVDLAIKIFKQIDAVGIVWSLEEIQYIEEKNLLNGYLALLLGNFDVAEKLFLQSTKPREALDMRRDLLHWDKALNLAKRLAEEEVPMISKEYAQQLEFMGNYSQALVQYENGLIKNPDESNEQLVLEHNNMCNSGIARMSIRTGDIRKGIEIAASIEGRAVKRDCATILEQIKQYSDAAYLYELGHFYDRAAAVSLKAKNWTKVSSLLPKIHSPKIHTAYGKVMEREKKFKQAAMAYKNARDYDNLVRLLLEHLNKPEEAVCIVRESRSVEGARLVAKFFTKLGDQDSAIQFLVLSQCQQEAFHLAETEQKMDIFADAVEDDGTVDVFLQLADYYAKNMNSQKAGFFYYKAGQYSKALDYLLTNGEDTKAISTAIACVVEARNPDLNSHMIDYLLGEIDGIPKNPKFLFKYYISMKMYREAAKTAVVIATEEQANGSYRTAHKLLFGMYQELQNERIKVPFEVQNNLMLLHSYLIIKSLVKRGEHMKAARMLIRVAGSISHFPAHVVSILTTTVIECTKAGLKQSAFKFAVELLKDCNRKSIDEKYRKKIEAVVRKSDKLPDPEELKTCCPYCDNPTEESILVCASCKNLIPYCIVTGLHLVTNDFTTCPSCGFPGFYSELKRLKDEQEGCPMCGEELSDLKLVDDVKQFLMNDQKNRQ
ncbi:WD repeat membrane protein, putative [Brugia malayi]|uniref:WD repeat membrane protein, putative n=2 Tax=Brugia malayi TaxID=6279 RepID=A0A4E9F5C4_BRUMA|nr:WD repeat membrane protein, putative [Brugia malayi]VIO91983.1 WD repeat membrane protein, putative [Brugia malayi]